MAGSQIPTAVTIINSILGFQAVSLTNMWGDSEPQIAAGSKVEIASAFFTFNSDTDVTGWSAIATTNTAYIALTPAGAAGVQTLTASWVTKEPVWVDSKQGYYLTSGSNVRVIGSCSKNSDAIWRDKSLLEVPQRITKTVPWRKKTGAWSYKLINKAIYSIGEWDMQTYPFWQFLHGLNTNWHSASGHAIFLSFDATIRNDNDPPDFYQLNNWRGYIDADEDYIYVHVVASALRTSDFSATSSTIATRGWVTVEYNIDAW